jgi:hypothetical protein
MRLDLAYGPVIVLVIGTVVGLVFHRVAGPSWFMRQIAGPARSLITSALVGIAGAFIGFHAASIVGLSQAVSFAGAAAGAIVVLYGWRLAR